MFERIRGGSPLAPRRRIQPDWSLALDFRILVMTLASLFQRVE
jgi:hypothetical protein